MAKTSPYVTRDFILNEFKQRMEGKTQREFAAELGVSVVYVNDILNARRGLSDTIISAMGYDTERYYKLKD